MSHLFSLAAPIALNYAQSQAFLPNVNPVWYTQEIPRWMVNDESLVLMRRSFGSGMIQN
jgi:hypothetical protein